MPEDPGSPRWGRGRSESVVLGVALAGWIVLVGYLIPRHEPWADEAQAWQLARSLGLRELFGHYLHYEITPGLWHLILWVLARLHVSYVGMHWLTAGLALIGVALLLWRAPFPLALRVAMVFTYYVAYQYAVVARSYVLFTPLLFVLATVWPKRAERPLMMALLLGLLANAAAHGLVMSFGLVVALVVEVWRGRRSLRVSKVRWMVAGGVWLAAACFALWCILPPHDAEWVKAFHGVIKPADKPAMLLLMPHQQHPWMHRLPVNVEFVLRTLLWFRTHLSTGLSANIFWGDAAWLLLCIHCWRQKQLRMMIAPTFLAIFMAFTRFNVYHAGLLWLLFLFVWWVTWPARQDRWSVALLVIVACCVVVQLAWTVEAVRYERREAYSPDRDGAVVLGEYLQAGKRVDVAVPERTKNREHGEFFAVGMEPYFAVEPLSNMRARYWIWTDDSDMRRAYLRDVADHSAVVLLEDIDEDTRVGNEAAWLEQQGYRKTKAVCGRVFYPNSFKGASRLCHTFYETGDRAK